MIVWCTMAVLMKYGNEVIPVETAVRGKVVKSYDILYLVDFSEYAKKQGYIGDWSKPKEVVEYSCIKE